MSEHVKSLKIRLEAMRGCGANKCRICDDHANAALLHLSALKDENDLLKDQLKRMEEERDHNYGAAANWKEEALRQQEIGMEYETDLIEANETITKLKMRKCSFCISLDEIEKVDETK